MGTIEKYYKVTVQQEYKKNPKLSPTDVQELLEWCNENINIHGKIIDLQIIMFLYACDYDKEYTKKVILQYFTLRAKKCASYFSARDPMQPFNMQQTDVININIISDDDTGYSYVWAQLKIFDASQFYPIIYLKLLLMAIELDQVEHGIRPGYTLILDSNEFGISHALRFPISDTRHLITYIQDGTPYVFDKICIINVTSGFQKLFAALKHFMSTELKNKFLMKSNSKTNEFIETLPQNVVPKDYGGLAPTMSETNEILKKKLLENREYFLDEEIFRNGKVKDKVELQPQDDEDNKDNIHSFSNLSID